MLISSHRIWMSNFVSKCSFRIEVSQRGERDLWMGKTSSLILRVLIFFWRRSLHCDRQCYEQRRSLRETIWNMKDNVMNGLKYFMNAMKTQIMNGKEWDFMKNVRVHSPSDISNLMMVLLHTVNFEWQSIHAP